MEWLTAEYAGIGGSYKQSPADFFVEELPLYPCSGNGEHLFIQVEKIGITTLELVAQMAKKLQIAPRSIGYAGLKDARATTRQWFSLPLSAALKLPRLSALPLKILAQGRHGNKLRLGHLAGNRFRILLHKPLPDALPTALKVLEKLAHHGVPNRFGEQRYGLLGNSQRLGLCVLRQEFGRYIDELIGDPALIKNPQWQQASTLYRAGKLTEAAQCLPGKMTLEKNLLLALNAGESAKALVLNLPKSLLRLHLSALQSALFDQLLAQRMPQLAQLQEGDLAMKHANGACFLVTDPTTEQPRADQFEISPTAPLFGSKTMYASGQPGERERALLKQHGIRDAAWKRSDGLTMSGDRRALRVPIHLGCASQQGADLLLEFCLPKGSYATCVLDELIKPDKNVQTLEPLSGPVEGK